MLGIFCKLINEIHNHASRKYQQKFLKLNEWDDVIKYVHARV